MKSDWPRRGRINQAVAPSLCRTAFFLCLLFLPLTLFAEEPRTISPLRSLLEAEVHTQLLPGTQVLIDPVAIERFLQALEGVPPDWATVYGHGRHDPGHDERLFNLNRERDAARQGKEALHRRIAFVWSGELSAYDSENGGFRVALGPKLTPTAWGVVRFKYDDLPGNLVAVPTPGQREGLLQRIEQGHVIEIDVVMAGTLIPDESIVYDFSHDQEGLGVIMPVVRVEEIVYLLPL